MSAGIKRIAPSSRLSGSASPSINPPIETIVNLIPWTPVTTSGRFGWTSRIE